MSAAFEAILFFMDNTIDPHQAEEHRQHAEMALAALDTLFDAAALHDSHLPIKWQLQADNSACITLPLDNALQWTETLKRYVADIDREASISGDSSPVELRISSKLMTQSSFHRTLSEKCLYIIKDHISPTLINGHNSLPLVTNLSLLEEATGLSFEKLDNHIFLKQPLSGQTASSIQGAFKSVLPAESHACVRIETSSMGESVLTILPSLLLHEESMGAIWHNRVPLQEKIRAELEEARSTATSVRTPSSPGF